MFCGRKIKIWNIGPILVMSDTRTPPITMTMSHRLSQAPIQRSTNLYGFPKKGKIEKEKMTKPRKMMNNEKMSKKKKQRKTWKHDNNQNRKKRKTKTKNTNDKTTQMGINSEESVDRHTYRTPHFFMHSCCTDVFVNSTPHTSHFLVDSHLMTRTCVAQVSSLACAVHISHHLMRHLHALMLCVIFSSTTPLSSLC